MISGAAEFAPARRWCRVRELREMFGLSKPWTFAALRDGKILGKKIDGILLIDLDSVRELIDGAPDWSSEPRVTNTRGE